MRQLLAPGKMYHIFNRGNRFQPLFYNEENYHFFLRRYHRYLDKYLDTLAYCLLDNHFHFAIRTKPTNDILTVARQDLKLTNQAFKQWHNIDMQNLGNGRKKPELAELLALKFTDKWTADKLATRIISNQFRKFFMSFSKSINKENEFKGSLLQKIYRRKLIAETRDLASVVCYIHRNPLHHKTEADWENYPWSSYSSFLDKEVKTSCKDEVLKIFGGVEVFQEIHKTYAEDWALGDRLGTNQKGLAKSK